MTASPRIMITISKGWAGIWFPGSARCGHMPSVNTRVMAALTCTGILLVENTGSMNMTMLTRIMVSMRLSTSAWL